MKKIDLINLVVVFGAMIFLACSEKQSPPIDAEGRPLIEKLGTIDCDLVETTPVVFQNMENAGVEAEYQNIMNDNY